MLLMRLLSPRTLPNQSEWKFRHRVYMFLLRTLALLYFRGKIDDCVVVNGVEVVHTLYDVWFENELRRFGIEMSLSYHVTPKNCLDKRWYHRFGVFKWQEELRIIHQGKRCCIVRRHWMDFDTDVEGILRSSSGKMASIRFNDWVEESVSSNTEASIEIKKPRTIHFKETDDTQPETHTETASKKTSSEDNYTQHKGFEENDIF